MRTTIKASSKRVGKSCAYTALHCILHASNFLIHNILTPKTCRVQAIFEKTFFEGEKKGI